MNAYQQLKHYALRLLARRDYSKFELRRKLKTKSGDDSVITALLVELSEQSLQCDRRFCESYVRYRSDAGMGPRRLAQELRARGIEDSLINEYVWQAAIDWQALLTKTWARKYQRPKTAAEYAKQQRFLLHRGFEPEHIHQLLSFKHEKSEH